MTNLDSPSLTIQDFHIHSTFSDGFSTPHDIVLASIEKNVTNICITDHYSFSKPAIMDMHFEEYYRTIETLKRQFSSKINVSIGLEIDVSSIDFFEVIIDSNIPWDLLLFEYIFLLPDWEKNFQKLLKFKENFPDYNVGLSHTRFSRVTESKFEYVSKKIKEFDIIIELNTNYRNYSDNWFSYLDDSYHYSIGSDAHHINQVGNVTEAIEFLRSRDIPFKQLITL